ncbi:MAG: c-type cytochrome [Gemmataceae bacterium]|nr:c-type cytochrome [Gemmataceae bacterium]
MAATDQTYREQKRLDLVFGVSSVVLLVSTIGMFVQDYNRPWKTEQRQFRDVESALATRQALNDLPHPKVYEEAKQAVETARDNRQKKKKYKTADGSEVEQTADERIAELERELARLQPQKEAKAARLGDVKAQVESYRSFYDIAIEHNGPTSAEARAYKERVEKLQAELAAAQADLDAVLADMKAATREKDQLEGPLRVAETRLNRVTDDLVRRARAAVSKQWGVGDWFRSLWIIEAFASPTKIHQFTLHDLTIDYNFKGVTRFDRCMSCHLGIDKPAFTKENLRALLDVPDDLHSRLEQTREILTELREQFKDKPDLDKLYPNPDHLTLKPLSGGKLTPARVNEFCAHPRQELFVNSNSKHPAEKFGCTICHSGQGSATDFYWASHTPNTPAQQQQWQKEHGWGSVHHWDFPMSPRRFVESSCLKCHHQVTDLITDGNKHEAPKLLRGYNLIRENGCFGCHEIAGTKDGKPIGPDLRLEPSPPLELLPPEVRARVLEDRENPPGTLRKVGPSLFRLAEKTNEDWVARWVKSPRSFRPDTRMPHFYGLSNNDPSVLPKDQKQFPDAEVLSIARYLFEESRKYLGEVEKLQQNKEQELAKAQKTIDDDTALLGNKAKLADMTNAQKDAIKKRIEEAKTRIAMLKAAPPIHSKDQTAALAKLKGDVARGRKLFSERGCMACHSHSATHKEHGEEGTADYLPPVLGEADFGPTLSQITAKLGTRADAKASARVWLVRWISNPHQHSARTRMPVTHLTEQEAVDVADWLLAQKATDLGDWDSTRITFPARSTTTEKSLNDTLQDLARVYLVRIISKRDMDRLFGEGLDATRVSDLPEDEKKLAERLAPTYKEKDQAKRELMQRDQLLWYNGRKAVGRLGCYGCHDVLGFDNAKPIGTPLNEWGKKPSDRLAFEDINNFLKDKYTVVESWTEEGIASVLAKKKEPYEKFFADALLGHSREGYLHQKIKDPRSYDYNRLRAWDDRSRMPQFKFAHPRPSRPESGEELKDRVAWEKAAGTALAPGGRIVRALAFEPRGEVTVEANSNPEVLLSLVVYDPDGSQVADAKGLGAQLQVNFTPQKKHKYYRVEVSNHGTTEAQVELAYPGKDVVLPAEPAALMQARAEKAEAEAREAVMTFVLGLTAEAIPLHYLPSPSTDRLAEIKGRQVLDKFNCAGCHTIRPGVFEFKVTPAQLKQLESDYQKTTENEALEQDFFFPESKRWAGHLPPDPHVLLARGMPSRTRQPVLALSLSEALAFKDDKGSVKDIRASSTLRLLPGDVTFPPRHAMASPQALRDFLRDQGPYGGAFADLLAKYLVEWGESQKAAGKENLYEAVGGESGNARAAVPPLLINQGERTQPDWLYRFLLDPQRIRRMTVLRMPRFNMSEDEARLLVHYFAAVDRLNNPSLGLTFPHPALPQRGDLNDAYWRARSAEYVKRLESMSRDEPKNGKKKGKTFYQETLEELGPVWARIEKDTKAQADEAESQRKKAEAMLKDLEAQEKKEKDAVKLTEIKLKVKAADETLKFWGGESERLKALAGKMSVDVLREQWRDHEAAAHGGFRMLTRGICSTCHEVGNQKPGQATQGPSLNIVNERLRPEWVTRWIANPKRHVPYNTPMPPVFPRNGKEYRELVVGEPLEQILTVRDALMNWLVVSELPLNRYWLTAGVQADEKKK